MHDGTTLCEFIYVLVHELHHIRWFQRKVRKQGKMERQVEEAAIATMLKNNISLPLSVGGCYRVTKGFATRMKERYNVDLSVKTRTITPCDWDKKPEGVSYFMGENSKCIVCKRRYCTCEWRLKENGLI